MGVAADDLARHAPTERPVVLRVNAGRQSRQLAVGDAEGLGDLALGAECVHPLEGQHHGVFCLVASGFPPNLHTPSPARPCIQLSTVCDPACDSGYLSAALILFGASHTFWHYPLRALFATRPKHPKPARTPASTPDPHHARSTTNPSNSLFYLVKLGTEGFCSHSRFCIKMSVLVVELGGFEPPAFSLRTRRATNCAIAPRQMFRLAPLAG